MALLGLEGLPGLAARLAGRLPEHFLAEDSAGSHGSGKSRPPQAYILLPQVPLPLPASTRQLNPCSRAPRLTPARSRPPPRAGSWPLKAQTSQRCGSCGAKVLAGGVAADPPPGPLRPPACRASTRPACSWPACWQQLARRLPPSSPTSPACLMTSYCVC
jgi:hypothetical protein